MQDLTKGNRKYINSVNVAIDAMIPFKLGWSVDRAARALCHLNHRDYRYLSNVMITGEVNHANPAEPPAHGPGSTDRPTHTRKRRRLGTPARQRPDE